MFSVTGNLLPGGPNRPEITTLVVPFSEEESKNQKESLYIVPEKKENDKTFVAYEIRSEVSGWYTFGCIPIISTFSGSVQAFLGTIHAVSHVALAIFDAKNRQGHLSEAKIGARHIKEGLIFAIPIIGNIAASTTAKKEAIIRLCVENIRQQCPQDFSKHVYLVELASVNKKKSKAKKTSFKITKMPIEGFNSFLHKNATLIEKMEILKKHQRQNNVD